MTKAIGAICGVVVLAVILYTVFLLGCTGTNYAGDYKLEGDEAAGKMVGYSEAGGTVTCTNADTWYQYTSESATQCAGFNTTYSSTGHYLEIDTGYDGAYKILVFATAKYSATSNVHIGIAKNGNIGTFGQSGFEVKFANRETTLSVGNYLSLVAGDTISCYFKTDNAGDVILVTHFNLLLELMYKE